jgi:hypothetical protein
LSLSAGFWFADRERVDLNPEDSMAWGAIARASWALGAMVIVLAAAPGRVEQPAARATAGLPESSPLVAESDTVLGHMEPGLWEVRRLGGGAAAPQSICVADTALLMQLQHGQAPCTHRVTANDDRGVTVHYSCAANDFGHSSLRMVTPRLAKIDTQGFIGKSPFSQRVEVQRLGECPAAKAANRR